MRRLYIKLVLWLNGYCTKHGIRKTYEPYHGIRKTYEPYFGNRCYLCTRERVTRERAEMNARDTYLDKLLEEFNR